MKSSNVGNLKRLRNLPSFTRTALKIAVSAGLMAFLLGKISIGRFVSQLQGLDRTIFALAMMVFLVSNVLGSVQWHLLLHSAGVRISFARSFKFYFVGLFFNNFLPANIGGDAVKVYDVSRTGGSVYQVIAATLLDRLIGIFSLCFLAAVSTLFLMRYYPFSTLGIYLAIFVVCMALSAGFYFLPPLRRFLRRFVGLLRPVALDRRGTHILNHLSEFKTRKRFVLKLALLSLVTQSLRVITHVLVGVSLGVGMSTAVVGLFFVFVPILSLAMIPPITINGLGVREGLGILLFARAGIGPTDAFTLEFLAYIVSVLISLIGLGFFVARRAEERTTAAVREPAS